MGNIPFTIAGLDLALIETGTKDDETKTYHVFRNPSTNTSGAFGVQIPALAEDLPDFVVVDGHVITLEHGLTPAEIPLRDKATGRPVKGADGKTVMLTVPEDERRARAAAETSLLLPTIEEQRTVAVAVSVTKDGGWNVKIVANRKNLESPEERQARQHESAKKRQATNLAAIQAALGLIAAA